MNIKLGLFVQLCIVIAEAYMADGAPLLQASPSTVRLGMTRELTVNCSITNWELSNLLGVMSLTLSRSRNSSSHEHVNLASVNSLLQDRRIMQYPGNDNGSVTGTIDDDAGEASISVIWQYPTSRNEGEYRCTIHGLDVNGLLVTLQETTIVKVETPDKNFLIDTILRMQKQMDYEHKSVGIFQKQVKQDIGSLHKENEELESRIDSVQQILSSRLDLKSVETIQKVDTLLAVVSELNISSNTKETALRRILDDVKEEVESLQNSNKETLARMDVLQNDTAQRLYMLEILSHNQTTHLDALHSTLFEISPKFTSRRYYVPKKNVAQVFNDMEAADIICKMLGGYPAEIGGWEELSFLANFTRHVSGLAHPVFSGTDARHEGRWVNARTGERLIFTEWGPSEPNGGTKENCLFLCSAHLLKMCDSGCSGWGTNVRFVCEIPE